MKKLLNSWIPRILAVALIVAGVGVQSHMAFAASVTSFSDNMSRLKTSTASNHEIKFASPTGIASGNTVTLTFEAGFSMGSVAFGDIDFATGNSSNCSSATYTEQTLAATPSGATWGAAVSGQVLTLTSGTGTSAAGNCVRFRIGTNATEGGAGTNQITNPGSAANYTIVVGGTFGDTGTAAVAIITDDQVVITATLGPSISFSISDNTIGFGALSLGSSRYATGDNNGSASSTTAHTLAASTNATSGYAVYVVGPTLTSGANDIDAIGGTNTAPAPGTEQFGVRYTATGGSGTVTAPYADSGYAYNATTTQQQIASAAAATDTTTYNADYVANISISTAAGSYSTTLTYTATATF